MNVNFLTETKVNGHPAQGWAFCGKVELEHFYWPEYFNNTREDEDDVFDTYPVAAIIDGHYLTVAGYQNTLLYGYNGQSVGGYPLTDRCIHGYINDQGDLVIYDQPEKLHEDEVPYIA